MNGIMKPIPFPQLINWIQSEYKNEGSVFGIRKEKFFIPSSFNFEFFGEKTSTPIGPAAGPGTQLAQNILSAFLAGGRIIELKTVQTMDGEELRKAISRPNINAAEEGYNTQWSTELTVAQAMEEYIKAWFLCHIFAVEFKIAEKCDCIFTMSAGYSLEGIKSEKIDSFIEGMKNAQNTEIWQQCHDEIAANLLQFKNFTKADLNAIPPQISSSIILSTFYNCPGDETEKTATYFITEKNLHTYIKFNPTLLGYETCRSMLDAMGYGHIAFSDRHFNDDIQLNEAVRILRHLKVLAAKAHIDFGVKLTNTLPVEITRNELPGKEMYLSGRPVYPLSICTAKKITEIFHGQMPVSYSGGADFFNLKDILETGIKPVTMVTNMLKPGGIERFNQLAKLAANTAPYNKKISIKALNSLCDAVQRKKRYHKDPRRRSFHKALSALPLFDCTIAPCTTVCPLHIKIPQFIDAVAGGHYLDALEIIAADNTAPSITGLICERFCRQSCRRFEYDDPVQTGKAKLSAVYHAQEAFTNSLTAAEIKTDACVAVIGAGLAGIAAAVFLRRNGVPVTVYEKRDGPYGAVKYLIPSFRISDEDVLRDFQIALKTGVEFIFNAPEKLSIAELKEKHSYIIVATGAWNTANLLLTKGQEKTLMFSDFLEEAKKTNYSYKPGKKIAVIGGDSIAIDCARAAKRCKGVDSVTVIYNSTKEFMPASIEAVESALSEKVTILELLSPESWEQGILTCEIMIPGDYDNSVCRIVKGTGKKTELRFNTVINASGAEIDARQFADNNIILKNNLPITNANLESSVADVYIAGSCRTGGSKIAESIADGKIAAFDILNKLKIKQDFSIEALPSSVCYSKYTNSLNINTIIQKKGVICEAANNISDGQRCLSCNVICEICADVCPNRANISVAQKAGKPQMRQIIHIDSMCNQCGNCASFCPYEGKPYTDKFTIYSTKEDFEESETAGMLKTGNSFLIRLEDKTVVKYMKGGKNIKKEMSELLDTIINKYSYLFYS